MSNADRPVRSSERDTYRSIKGGIAMKKIELFLEELYKSFSHIIEY